MRWFLRTLGIAYAAIVCGSTVHAGPASEPELQNRRRPGDRDLGLRTWRPSEAESTGARNATFYRFLTRALLNLIAAVSAPQGSLLAAIDHEASDLTNLGEASASLSMANVDELTPHWLSTSPPD